MTDHPAPQPATLPIDAVLPDLLAALARAGRAVLQAPPGAGKTTRVPLALLGSGLAPGRIVMLEPRRLAARAAAERMAETLGEAVGRSVGYRIRGEARVSAATRIEVVTEGILTRMLQHDPGLSGIGCVIFDEFHERSLSADLGLALTWEARGALRPDLLLIVMSATLHAAPVAGLLDEAPVITATGRAFPVETRWLARPALPGLRFEARASALIAEAVAETEGSPGGGVLAFLPGEGEIARVAALLNGRLPAGCTIRPLYGAMRFQDQRAAIAPATSGRKIVLATAIAESALTIEDIRTVVDCGRARRARFDPASGMTRLVTEPVTRAEADQRRGRAGRVAPGRSYRMWSRAEEGALAAFPPPEIAAADLAALALDLALWGAPEGAGLAFLTPPPAPALAEARALLAALGALDRAGRVTAHGRALAALPLHPRLGHMLVTAGPSAAMLAALLGDRDPCRGAGADIGIRLAALHGRGTPPGTDPAALARIRDEARRLARLVAATEDPPDSAGMAALAYPDRIGLRRPGGPARYVLSGGKGAVIDEADPLSRARLIVATDLDGDQREARLRQGAELSEATLRRLFGAEIGWQQTCRWSRREGRVLARRQERFGALVLTETPWPDAPPEAIAAAALDGLRQTGLPQSDAAGRLRARAAFLAREGADLPALDDAALFDGADALILPFLAGRRSAADLAALDLTGPLLAALGPAGRATLDRLAPASYTTPLGRKVAIDYDGDHPAIALRLQEMFGTTEHPVVGPRRLPLRITLLSPAGAPVQVTLDLPRFWATSYAEVRKAMRGQYPKHPWPEDPAAAAPTLRAKPRAR